MGPCKMTVAVAVAVYNQRQTICEMVDGLLAWVNDENDAGIAAGNYRAHTSEQTTSHAVQDRMSETIIGSRRIACGRRIPWYNKSSWPNLNVC